MTGILLSQLPDYPSYLLTLMRYKVLAQRLNAFSDEQNSDTGRRNRPGHREKKVENRTGEGKSIDVSLA